MAGIGQANPGWEGSTPYPGANYQSDGTQGYIPEVWAGKLIERWYAASVIAAITNTDYEGMIKSYGDNVIIRSEPAIAISDYTVGQALSYEVPGETLVELAIDTAKSWAFTIDDVQKHQSDLKLMSIFANNASEQLKVVVDTDVLSKMQGTSHASNNGATAGAISGNIALGVTTAPVAVTEANAVEAILRMGQALDEQNAPETGRWVVIPASYAAVLKDSLLRVANEVGDSTSIVRNGKIGMIDRFTVYTSNNLPNGVAASLVAGEFNIYAGIPSSLAFASQIVKNETLPNPDTFGELMRGLQVYGYKTVKPEGLVEMIATIAHT